MTRVKWYMLINLTLGQILTKINEEHKRRIRYASLKITCLLPAKALTGAVICSILIKGRDDYRKKVQTMKLMI